MVYIICVLIGTMAAFIGSLLGLGGGIVLIPAMLFLYHYLDAFSWATPQTIVSSSLIIMFFTALSSTISYNNNGLVDYKTGLLLLSGSIPGGVFGSWLNQFVEADQFYLYFGLLMIILSMLFLMKRKPLKPDSTWKNKQVRTFRVDGQEYQYTVSIWLSFFISLFVGILSGLFGLGGGSIMVPAMILLFGFPVYIAIATSMFMIFFISIIGSSTHILPEIVENTPSSAQQGGDESIRSRLLYFSICVSLMHTGSKT